MKKIRKTIKAIRQIIQHPWLLNHVLNDNNVWQKQVQKKYAIQLGLPVVEINDLLPNFSETLNTFAFLGGGSLPTDLALLKGVCKKFKDCRYFEIGTWRGESIANVADCAATCYALDLSPEALRERGLSEAHIELLGFYSKSRPNITHLHGDSTTFDFAALDQKFDVIFIDGDHHYDFVLNDTKKVFQHLIHEQSIVVWHDYAYHPEQVRFEVLAAILDGTPAEFHQHIYQVSNTMSAIFTRENLPSQAKTAVGFPNKRFKVSLEIDKTSDSKTK